MNGLVVDYAQFLRRDDPRHEMRDLELKEGWSVWETVRFLDDQNWFDRRQIAIGWEPEMRKLFADRKQELLDEGFTLCEPTKPGE